MKRILLQSLALLGMGLVTHSATATPVKRIDIGEDTPTKIYAVSAGSTKGVYTLSTADANTDKISGSTYIQYSFDNSGGTFVSKEKLYGTKATDGLIPQIYAITATAEGGEEGPWSHTFYKYGYTGYIIAKDMTYVAGEDKIYGLFRTNPYSDLSQSLAVYDGEKVEATKIADLSTTFTAIAADSKGELYAVSGNSGKLVKIDKASGEITEIGSLGVVMQSTPQSAAIDPATDKMYWVAGANAYSAQSMFEVDLATGAATKLYDFPLGTKFQALWIPAPEADKNAPGAPENLSALFTGNGKNVQVSFTAPDKTFGGNTLQGELDYTIYVDGVENTSGKTTAGAEVSVTVEMEEGTHKVEAACSNAKGKGQSAATNVYAGFDTPANISNLTFEIEENTAKISWTAPEGVNGGLVDASRLSYNVTRNPGNVEVASGLKECSVTDELPDDFFTEYTWTVTVKYEGADDQELTTSGAMYGKPYTIPYSQNFNDVTSLGQAGFAMQNENDRSPVWALGEADGNRFAEIPAKYYFEHDDYLFTAPLELVKGATYTLKFKIGANAVAGTYWENGEQKTRAFEMSVLLAKEQNNSAESLIEPELSTVTYISDQETAGAFKEYSVDFKVEADGVYSIAFFDKSTHFLQDIAFRLDDIEITGVFPTPASVEGISAEPTEKGSRDIVVSFTAPAADLNGNPLETLEAIDIYRGSAFIATLTETDGVAPGAELSYTDENAPRGFLSYSAVARNGQLSSPRAVTTVMSGLMNDLVISDITAPTFVNIDSKEEFKVTVFNNGADIALDYRVILLVDGVEAESLPGELIHTDEEITYTFEINWIDTSDEGTKLDYSAEIEFYGDENTENNKSDVYPVEFEYKLKDSVSDAAISDIEISAANGAISVYAANGTPVSVYAADGRAICTGSTNGNVFTAKLHSGVYVVVAGNKTAKVTL